MAQVFKHSPAATVLATSNTLVYGPVATGVTAILFAGTFANLDNTNQLMHYLTLQTYDGVSNYTTLLNKIPVPYGSSSKCPKIVLLAGESLYASADTASMISASVNSVELS
jgi:hypothetical protein